MHRPLASDFPLHRRSWPTRAFNGEAQSTIALLSFLPPKSKDGSQLCRLILRGMRLSPELSRASHTKEADHRRSAR